MAFLDFFKKKRKEPSFSEFDIDVPPAPPTEEFPDIPSFKQSKKLGSEPIESEEKIAEEIIPEKEGVELSQPIFVDINLFRDTMDEINLTKSILKENDDTLARVSEFRQSQEKEFKKWQDSLLDIQKKLIFVDKGLFE